MTILGLSTVHFCLLFIVKRYTQNTAISKLCKVGRHVHLSFNRSKDYDIQNRDTENRRHFD